ncbi:MAG: hypothetical protein JSV60_05585 [Desulfobacterales bacterium]|jgi:hypothetical protein|nr:MAG: hypothetical protein JSV60_05585 [Desulfobacterales bacterium]
MGKQDNSDFVVLFKRVKISRRQAKKVGFAGIFGFVGALISVGTIGPDNRFAVLVIALFFACIGYFALSNRRSGK